MYIYVSYPEPHNSAYNSIPCHPIPCHPTSPHRFSPHPIPTHTSRPPQAFLLYDTFGFPLEITQELAAEQGLTVDLEGFSHEMEAQRQRSKEALKTVDLTAQAALGGLVAEVRLCACAWCACEWC